MWKIGLTMKNGRKALDQFQNKTMKTFNIKVLGGGKSTKRTKERVRQHGPEFIVKEEGRPTCMGTLSLLCRSVKTDWFGWLPVNEIEIEESNESN